MNPTDKENRIYVNNTIKEIGQNIYENRNISQIN